MFMGVIDLSLKEFSGIRIGQMDKYTNNYMIMTATGNNN